MGLTDFKLGLSDIITAGGETLKNSLSFISDLKEAGIEKLNVFVEDILGLTPLIEVTGFTLDDIGVDIGIPPGISLGFSKTKDVDPETINQLLEENNEKEILRMIVKSLQKADDVQKGMNLANYKFRGLSMKIGLPPDISLKFRKIEPQNQD